MRLIYLTTLTIGILLFYMMIYPPKPVNANDVELAFERGVDAAMQSRYAEAEFLFKIALESLPNNPDILANLVWVLDAQNNRPDALLVLHTWMRIDPLNPAIDTWVKKFDAAQLQNQLPIIRYLPAILPQTIAIICLAVSAFILFIRKIPGRIAVHICAALIAAISAISLVSVHILHEQISCRQIDSTQNPLSIITVRKKDFENAKILTLKVLEPSSNLIGEVLNLNKTQTLDRTKVTCIIDSS